MPHPRLSSSGAHQGQCQSPGSVSQMVFAEPTSRNMHGHVHAIWTATCYFPKISKIQDVTWLNHLTMFQKVLFPALPFQNLPAWVRTVAGPLNLLLWDLELTPEMLTPMPPASVLAAFPSLLLWPECSSVLLQSQSLLFQSGYFFRLTVFTSFIFIPFRVCVGVGSEVEGERRS